MRLKDFRVESGHSGGAQKHIMVRAIAILKNYYQALRMQFHARRIASYFLQRATEKNKSHKKPVDDMRNRRRKKSGRRYSYAYDAKPASGRSLFSPKQKPITAVSPSKSRQFDHHGHLPHDQQYLYSRNRRITTNRARSMPRSIARLSLVVQGVDVLREVCVAGGKKRRAIKKGARGQGWDKVYSSE